MTEYYKTADLPKHDLTEDEKRQVKEHMDNVQEEQRRIQDCLKGKEYIDRLRGKNEYRATKHKRFRQSRNSDKTYTDI